MLSGQIGALVESGVDALIFESFASASELVNAVSTARSTSDIPIIAQAAFGREKRTSDGARADEVAVRCLDAGANVVGANCGFGVSATVGAIEQMASLGVPLSAFLNAGFPEKVEDRLVYATSPDYIVEAAVRLFELGARLVGGCCGTSPETIRQIARHTPARRFGFAVAQAPRKPSSRQEVPSDTSRQSVPDFPLIVELDPPRDLSVEPVVAAARALREAGALAISVSDNPFASVRMDNLAVAGAVVRESGTPVILHITGRDRNRIAIQSTMMGAHALGIRSLLCVTGDPVRMCEEPNTSGVFDLTSVGLVRMASDFNSGHRASGDSRTAFSIGVGANPNVRTISGQIDKLKRKIEAGASFVMTQPVFDESRLDILRQAIEAAGIRVPIYVGIMPLVSARHAEFLHNEIPGMLIPEEIRRKLALEPPGDQREAGIRISAGLVRTFSGSSDGFYFICPRNKIDTVIPLIQAARR